MLLSFRLKIVLTGVIGVFLLSTSVSADVVVPSPDVTSRVVVRATASAQSADKGSLRPGDQAELLGEVPSWYRIRLANGTEGFVPKRWTRVVSATGTPTTSPTTTTTTTPSFTMDVVDVGTGLGILVRGQDFTLVYDGGSNDDLARGPNNRMLAFIKAVVPTLTTIDDLILSHPHRDHVELLPDLFAAYSVKQVWDSGRLNPICGYRAFVTAVRDEPGVQYHTVTQDGGVGDVSFDAQSCYGQALPAEVVHVPHAARIQTGVPIILGQGAVMTILRADGAPGPNINDNSVVLRLDLGATRILLMGDSEAGGRQSPSVAPTSTSPEGILLACCASDLSAHILVAGHHGSKTSSRQLFLNAVGASTSIVSAGPTKYGSVVLPDQEVISELTSRGTVFRTDLNDATCGQNPAKIGPDDDGQAGGCDNVRVVIPAAGAPQADYWRGADTP
jgi:beta-lactamase superfamily II metal-dependent hydrolase